MSESNVPSSGSCVRCGRALDAASAKVGERWFGNAACARGGPCPREESGTLIAADRLYTHPRRTLRAAPAIELRRRSSGS